jgi:hypothetical protein
VDVLQAFFAAVEDLDGVVTSVEVLKDFGDDLSLGAGVFFAHRAVHQLDDVLVEVGDEVLQVVFVGLVVQTFATYPFDCVPDGQNIYLPKKLSPYYLLLHVAAFDLRRQPLVPQVPQQLGRLRVQTPVDDVHKERRLLQILQVNVVDVSDVGQAVVLRVLHVENPVDDLPLRHRHEVVVHRVGVHLALLVQRRRRLPEQLLELVQRVPPLRLVFRLQLGDSLVVEVDQDGRDGLEDGDRGDGVAVFSVPGVYHYRVVAGGGELVADHLQL